MKILKYKDQAIIVKNENGENTILSSRELEQSGIRYINVASPVDVRGYAQAVVLDENLKPENIRAGVSILGVIGTYEPETK